MVAVDASAAEARTGPAPGAADPAPFVRPAGDGLSRLELLVRGAHCAGCLKKIEGTLTGLDGVRLARMNLSTGRLRVIWQTGALEPAKIIERLDALGYPAVPFDPVAAARQDDDEGRALLRAMAVSGFAAANVMLLSVAVWADGEGAMGAGTRGFFHWISGLIAVPAALYAGRPFFRSAYNALKGGHANMDVPISLAVLLALAMSIFQTVQDAGHVYFEAAVMLLFFLLIGRYLDHRLRHRARAAARSLIALQAVTATRLTAQGTLETVAAGDVIPGDRLIIAPGDRVPVDGVIDSGRSTVDRSLVTGESAPVAAAPGETLHAGVVNLDGKLTLCATACADDSLVAELSRLIEAGEQARNRYVRLADKAAKAYVPLVHGLALATFVGWAFFSTAGIETALHHAIALLIITCPCALGLAVPAVQVVATGRLFQSGILVKSGDALERLAQTDHVVFDKTGTLTLGRPVLLNRDAVSPDDLALAGLLARGSRHPLSRALTCATGPGPVAEDLAEVPGQGLEAVIDGETVRLGRAEWAGAAPDADGPADAMTLYLRKGTDAPVCFLFRDSLRGDAPETLAKLSDSGFTMEMLSGDRQSVAHAIAGEAGIETIQAELTPQGKIARLDELAQSGRRVLMVGDGLNDAPALARAHASISPGTAAEVAQAAADLVFQGDRLAPVAEAVEVARKAHTRVMENFGFAVLYNACAVPIAAAGLVTPLIAAIAMSASSIVVTLNALRLAKRKG